MDLTATLGIVNFIDLRDTYGLVQDTFMDLKESTEQVQDILWTLLIVQNQNRIVIGPNRHKRTRPVQFIDHLDASEPVQLRSWKAKLPSTGPVQH